MNTIMTAAAATTSTININCSISNRCTIRSIPSTIDRWEC